jgi:hypothetical protein
MWRRTFILDDEEEETCGGCVVGITNDSTCCCKVDSSKAERSKDGENFDGIIMLF